MLPPDIGLVLFTFFLSFASNTKYCDRTSIVSACFRPNESMTNIVVLVHCTSEEVPSLAGVGLILLLPSKVYFGRYTMARYQCCLLCKSQSVIIERTHEFYIASSCTGTTKNCFAKTSTSRVHFFTPSNPSPPLE